MIQFAQVSKSFGDLSVLTEVSFTLPSGGVLVLTGTNGAGKTTLVKLVLGLLSPDSGRIIGTQGCRKAAVFQEDRLIEHLNAISNVRLAVARPLTNDEIITELQAAGLPEQALIGPVRTLSGGERRRVCLVRAMLAQADIVCLDEPFSGIGVTLDTAISYVRDRIRGRDTILVTHSNVEANAFGDNVVRLQL